MTHVIGLTGGIGSGKSTIARMFAELGVPVYYADDAGREVMASAAMLAELKAAFGSEIVENETVNRKKLADIVFSDKRKLQMLNDLVHPRVKIHFQEWLSQHALADFVLREAAILFESGSYKDCKKIITVTAPVATRIQRVMERDGVAKEHVTARMENQWTDERKMALSDYVIVNDDLGSTREQVVKIFKTLKKL
ncbi:dephospho-CoA kinase [Flavobacterium selenitireducens]|uniref:dephospho-CoA kinase n=1 Tax=Flavobacterium selenitireducens TaxID=2722704 RepID=UPI00168A7C6A|nr:dephospho-CoA kinase [Flavobacterium selenitireducens]MBD3582957.1 dephospho-CoA kinase [Flavobacterium selenitireducens]